MIDSFVVLGRGGVYVAYDMDGIRRARGSRAHMIGFVRGMRYAWTF